MTLSEKRLWSYLDKKKLGFLFRTQFGIGDYSLDFYCPEVKVCVEVDGSHHKDRLEEDVTRDEFLAGFGILTIRVPSLDLFDKDKEYQILHKWLEIIERTCRERRRDS
jgi:very-short-patch-repair endonuclease